MSRYTAAVLVSSLIAGCTFGPGWARRVEGTVVDARTEAPVANATVFSTYFSHSSLSSSHTALDTSWSVTDEQGRFSIPGHIALNIVPRAGSIWSPPFFVIHHPAYGLFESPISQSFPEQEARWQAQRWENLELRVTKGRWYSPTTMTDARYVLHACKRFQLVDGGCDHLCSLTVGVIACRDAASDSSQPVGYRKTDIDIISDELAEIEHRWGLLGNKKSP